MRTTVTIEENIVRELMRESKAESRSEAIRQAVDAYLQMKRRERFKKLAGSKISSLDWNEVERLEIQETK